MRLEPEPTLRRFVCIVLAGGLFALLAVALPSCGNGDEEEDSSDGAAIEVLEKAREAMEEAAAAGADTLFEEEFGKQQARLEKGEELIDEGNEKEARTPLRLALRAFGNLKKDSEEVKVLREQGLAAQKEADEAEKAAKDAKADVNAPREYKDARDIYDQAVAALQSTDTNKLKVAERSFKRAASYFATVVDTAKQNELIKAKAEAEKEAMIAQKAKAVEANAENLAPGDWLAAEQQARAAEIDLEGGNFQRAYDGFRFAAQAFANAILQAKAMAAIAEGQQPGERVPVEQPGEPAPVAVSGEEEAVGETPGVGVSDVPRPDLNDEDTFLLEYYKKLALGISQYDPGTGEVQISYTDGQIFKNDVTYPWRQLPYNGEYVKFEDPLLLGLPGSGGGPGPGPGPGPGGFGGPPLDSGFVFHGNTQGYILIPVPLTGDITVDYQLDLDRMNPSGEVNLVVFAEDDGVVAMGVKFVTIWTRDSSGNSKPLGRVTSAEYKKHPNHWFQKVGTVPMRLEIKQNEKREGYQDVKVFYKFSESDQPASYAVVKKGRSGFFGFQWRDIRFNIRGIRITSTLDKPAAVKILKDKLGVDVVPKTGDARATPRSGTGTRGGGEGAEVGVAAGSGAGRTPSGKKGTKTDDEPFDF